MKLLTKICAVATVAMFAIGLTVAAPQQASAAARITPNVLVGQDMTIGSTGESVVVLQGLLSELGYLNVPYGVPLGYFGPLTQQAVARYQAAHSVTPTAGYFGPLSKVAMHQHFSAQGWLEILGW